MARGIFKRDTAPSLAMFAGMTGLDWAILTIAIVIGAMALLIAYVSGFID